MHNSRKSSKTLPQQGRLKSTDLVDQEIRINAATKANKYRALPVTCGANS